MIVLALTAAVGLLQTNTIIHDVIPVPPVPSGPPTPPPPNHAGSYIAGNWMFPTAEMAAAAYPAKAIEDVVGGVVIIDCVVDVTGNLLSCDVLSEKPADYGFGAATVKIFLEGAHVEPASVQGGLVPGCRKKFVYHWTVG